MRGIVGLVSVALAGATAVCRPAVAATLTLNVPANTTNTFFEAYSASGQTFTSGDAIVKTGLGALKADSTFAAFKIGKFTVQEGVVISEDDPRCRHSDPNAATVSS